MSDNSLHGLTPMGGGLLCKHNRNPGGTTIKVSSATLVVIVDRGGKVPEEEAEPWEKSWIADPLRGRYPGEKTG